MNDFFQDIPLFPKDTVFTAEASELGTFYSREAIRAAAGVKIRLLDPIPERLISGPQVLGGLPDRLSTSRTRWTASSRNSGG